VDRTHDRNDHWPAFIPGLELNAGFYAEVVAPILADAFPRLRYAAALIGYGSDVLGYDTSRSTDHEWGPRLWLFLAEEGNPSLAEAIRTILAERLPSAYRGFSTHFGEPGGDGVRSMTPHPGGPIAHKIEVYPLRPALTSWLGVDPCGELSAVDWLLMPHQKLLEITAGRVFHDGLGALGAARATLAWYPRDVWLYLIAAQWSRIAEQEAFVGRAGEVGDELGSALVAASLVRDLMDLCFLCERRYAPYGKWFGTAFAELACAPRLLPLFRDALRAETWREREEFLAPAYELVAGMHNALGITAPIDPRPRPYHERPFRVLHAERFAAPTAAAIADPAVRAIVERAGLIGSLDQVSDNTGVVSDPAIAARLRALYE
jgi:hypothetical protein